MSTDAADREALLRALRATLDDERFATAPRTAALLVFLVERTIEAEADALDPNRIAVEFLGRSLDADPRADPTVRVLLSRLRRLLEACRATASRGTPVLSLPAQGFRVVLERAPGRGAPDSRRATDP